MFGIQQHESFLGKAECQNDVVDDGCYYCPETAVTDSLMFPVVRGDAAELTTAKSASGYNSLLNHFDVDQHASLIRVAHRVMRKRASPIGKRRTFAQMQARLQARKQARRSVLMRLTYAASGRPVYAR